MLLLFINSEKFKSEKLSFVPKHFFLKFMHCVIVIYYLLGVLYPPFHVDKKINFFLHSLLSEHKACNLSKNIYTPEKTLKTKASESTLLDFRQNILTTSATIYFV